MSQSNHHHTKNINGNINIVYSKNLRSSKQVDITIDFTRHSVSATMGTEICISKLMKYWPFISSQCKVESGCSFQGK